MAGDANVIRQFLVSLGFQVDQNSLKKFTTGLAGTEKGAMSVGKAVIAAGLAAEAMVVSFSSAFEKLFYASRRTDSSVENIQALEFGSRKIGLAAGQARESLESMVAAARMNPGLRAAMDGLLGKNTGAMDQADVMLELVQKLSSMPHFAGAQFAQMFGIDEKTFLMMKQGMPELIAAEEERRKLNRDAGIDAQAAAKAGVEYANSIRDITERLSALRDRLAIDMLPAFQDFNKEVIGALDNLVKFRLAEHPTLNAQVTGAKDLVKGAQEQDAGKMARGAWGVVSNPLALPLLKKGYESASTIARGVFNSVNDWRDSYRPGGSRSSNPAVPAGPQSSNPAVPEPVAAGSREPLGLRQNNPGNLRSWDGAPTNAGFAQFGSPAQGLAAMAQNLLTYQSKYGLNNIRDIIARWAPQSDGNNTASYIDMVSGRMRMKATDTLNLKDPAVFAKLMGAMIMQEQGYNPFGTTELMAAANSRVGNGGDGRQIVLNQKTDIHINGTDSPVETGRQVGLVQDDVTGNMVRNMRGAIQ